jgi:hypothetical protein
MPITTENLAKYPANWAEIRERIRARSGNQCEWCKVKNYAIGYRNDDGSFVVIGQDGTVDDWQGHATGMHLIRIVLTVAHIHDHDPANCSDANLAHLCQRCHNRHDQPMRIANARQSRKAGKAISHLFAST